MHLHLIHIQEFILQEDDVSSEQVIKYQNYIKWSRLSAVTADCVFTDCPCRHSVWLQLPMHSELKDLILQVL